jgi:DNA repair photolyase
MSSDLLAAVSNPPNPFQSSWLDWEGPPPRVELQVYRDHSKSILAGNNSPDLPFKWSLNPYRGCMHACAYCYARPSHEYLDFGAGTDFDRKITVKFDAAELLRKTFMKRSWTGEIILFSGNTDCYQPLEAEYALTRACLAVCLEFRNPVRIITKSALIERDADILAALARETSCHVTISLPFFDAEKARKVEPFAPSPARRIKTIRVLTEAGIPVGINVAPIIPGLNDEDIPAILEGARDAGATRAAHILVRLPGPVLEIFSARMKAAFPDRWEKIMHRIQEARGGAFNNSQFGERMRGQGHYWAAIHELFKNCCRRLGYDDGGIGIKEDDPSSRFRRPGEGVQMDLFG